MGAGGRPSKYRKKFCKEIIEYFNRPLRETKVREVASAGQVIGLHNEESVDLPTIAGFASSIGVHKDTIYEWETRHPEFSDALKQCRNMQENILVTHALKGDYHAGFTKFLLINNHGYKDKVEQDISHGGVNIKYEIVGDEK